MQIIPLPPPESPEQAYIDVSALDGGIINLPMEFYIKDSTEIVACPSLCFLLKHSSTGEEILYDMGLRRDIAGYPPVVRETFAKYMPFEVPQDVSESLTLGGIEPAEINTVIISHLHFDHVGNAEPFTRATFVVGTAGREQLQNGYPKNPNSDTSVDTIPIERTRFLEHSEFNCSIGPFPRAIDYFGDGSLYVIDAEGHFPGHVNLLARTSADGSWIYLGSDTAHAVELLTGEKELAAPRVLGGVPRCAHYHMGGAIEHIKRVRSLYQMPKVHVLLAHDSGWYKENKGGSAFLPGKIPAKQ